MLSFALAFLGASLVSAIQPISVPRADPSKQVNITNTSISLGRSRGEEDTTDRLGALPAPANSANSSSPVSNGISTACNSLFGHGDYAESCMNAIYHASFGPGPFTRQLSWGQRDEGNFDVPLPQKMASCEHLAHSRYRSRKLTGGFSI